MTDEPGPAARRPVRGALISISIGICLVAFGVYAHLNFFGYPGEAVGSGKIVYAGRSSDGYVYRILFTATDGRSVTASVSNPSHLLVGDTVDVSYRPGKPEDARIKTDLLVLLIAYALGGLGLLLTLTGFTALVRPRMRLDE